MQKTRPADIFSKFYQLNCSANDFIELIVYNNDSMTIQSRSDAVFKLSKQKTCLIDLFPNFTH